MSFHAGTEAKFFPLDAFAGARGTASCNQAPLYRHAHRVYAFCTSFAFLAVVAALPANPQALGLLYLVYFPSSWFHSLVFRLGSVWYASVATELDALAAVVRLDLVSSIGGVALAVLCSVFLPAKWLAPADPPRELIRGAAAAAERRRANRAVRRALGPKFELEANLAPGAMRVGDAFAALFYAINLAALAVACWRVKFNWSENSIWCARSGWCLKVFFLREVLCVAHFVYSGARRPPDDVAPAARGPRLAVAGYRFGTLPARYCPGNSVRWLAFLDLGKFNSSASAFLVVRGAPRAIFAGLVKTFQGLRWAATPSVRLVLSGAGFGAGAAWSWRSREARPSERKSCPRVPALLRPSR